MPSRSSFSELGQSLEVFQPGVADLGAVEVQHLELGQSFEVFQPGVADLGAAEVQSTWSWVNPLRCSSPASLTLVPSRFSLWSWVNPLRCSSPASLTLVPEAQLLELGQSLEVFQPGVADLGAAEVQHLELGQSLEVFQPGVADF